MILYDLNKECSWVVLDVVVQTSADQSNPIQRTWLEHDYERYLIPMSEVLDIIVHYTDKNRPIYPADYEKMKAEERARS